MANFNHLNKLFNNYNKLVGKLSPTATYNIYRPDYTAADQLGTIIASNIPARTDTGGEKFSEPRIPGIMYYDIFLDRTLVKAGDILVPVVSSYSSPAVTITHLSPMKACVGFQCDQLGKISEGRDDNPPLYNNVRFGFIGPTYPGTGLNEALENTMKVSRKKVVLFARQGIGELNPIIQELRLIQTNSDRNYSYIIRDITQYNSYLILSLEEDTL